jgi:S1-C subfamily serine protease
MQNTTDDGQEKLEQSLRERDQNSKKKKILIAVVLGLIAIAFFAVPKILKSFEKKEKFCLKNQTEIYEKYKDAVVLVQHTYAFEVSIKGSKPFLIEAIGSGNDEQTVTGTGFFVSENGKIVTNHHVAEPWKYGNEKGNSEKYIAERIAEILPDSIAEKEYKSFLEKNWNVYDDEGDYEDGEDYQNKKDAEAVVAVVKADSASVVKSAENNETSNVAVTPAIAEKPQIKYVSEGDIQVKGISIDISVALHGSRDSWLQCKVLKMAQDEDVDVAVLQLTSEKLPKSVTSIIDLNNAISDDSSIKPGTNAILIGYPMGMTLASTRKGIKVQVYQGQINKESDGVSLQYNVTSTHGASGSPVFNQCGQLIAVNYAGYDEAQGYNFGIVAKHAMSLAE